MQRVRVLHVLLHELAAELGDVDIQTFIRHQPAFVQGVFVGMRKRHELVILLEVRKLQACHDARGGDGRIPRPGQIVHHSPQSGLGGNFVKPAHRHRNRMDLAAAQHDHQLVADLLQAQRHLHQFAMVGRHADGVGEA